MLKHISDRLHWVWVQIREIAYLGQLRTSIVSFHRKDVFYIIYKILFIRDIKLDGPKFLLYNILNVLNIPLRHSIQKISTK